MMPQTNFVQPPRIATWLVKLFITGEEAESILGDLLEEFFYLTSKSGVGGARSWYWRQTVKTIAHLISIGFRIAPWATAAAVIGGFLVNRLVSGLPESAIFAVLEKYSVFDHHFNAYIFFATSGIAIGHVIASLFVGCMVALAAKGREMVATMALVLVFCAMTGAAVLVSLTSGHALFPWMLAWNFAGWLATVMGGAIVRTLRSPATPRPSHA
jgi:hypothetical protein